MGHMNQGNILRYILFNIIYLIGRYIPTENVGKVLLSRFITPRIQQMLSFRLLVVKYCATVKVL